MRLILYSVRLNLDSLMLYIFSFPVTFLPFYLTSEVLQAMGAILRNVDFELVYVFVLCASLRSYMNMSSKGGQLFIRTCDCYSFYNALASFPTSLNTAVFKCFYIITCHITLQLIHILFSKASSFYCFLRSLSILLQYMQPEVLWRSCRLIFTDNTIDFNKLFIAATALFPLWIRALISQDTILSSVSIAP